MPRQHQLPKKSRAFTIIEFGLVLIIFGLVFGTVTPAIYHHVESAKSVNTTGELQEIEKDIAQFLKDNDRYPDSLDELYNPVPLDPWGNPYQYLNIVNNPSTGKLRKDRNLVPINSDYDLYSMGPDGQSVSPLTADPSKDDIVRGRNGKYFGLATDF